MIRGNDVSVLRIKQSVHGRLDAKFTICFRVVAIKVCNPTLFLCFRNFDKDVYSSSSFVNGVRSGGFISTAGTLIVLELLVPVILPSASLLVVSVILT